MLAGRQDRPKPPALHVRNHLLLEGHTVTNLHLTLHPMLLNKAATSTHQGDNLFQDGTLRFLLQSPASSLQPFFSAYGFLPPIHS